MRPVTPTERKMPTTQNRIVEKPTTLMTGGTSCYFDLDQSRLDSLPQGGGPLDAPDWLPIGGAWNIELHDMQLSYGSVLRDGALA